MIGLNLSNQPLIPNTLYRNVDFNEWADSAWETIDIFETASQDGESNTAKHLAHIDAELHKNSIFDENEARCLVKNFLLHHHKHHGNLQYEDFIKLLALDQKSNQQEKTNDD